MIGDQPTTAAPGPFAARAASNWTFVAVLVATLCLGSVWFLEEVAWRIGPLVAYAVASISGSADVGRLQGLFDGRSVSFLGQQWGLRIFATALVMTAGAIAIGAVRRPPVLGGRLLRGVRLEDRRSDLRIQRRIRALVSGAIAALLGGLATIATFRDRARALPDYASAYFASSWLPLATILSPDGRGEAIWFDAVETPGFYSPELMREVFRAQFGRSFPNIALLFVSEFAFAGGVSLFVLSLIARRRVARSDRYRLAGVEIPAGKECYHVLVCGSPGSGKSTVIKDLLDQIRARGQRAIVYDIGGEYVEPYFRKGIDKLLNPLDARSEVWTLWADVGEPAGYDALAKSLFPLGGPEPFWAEASAVLFASAARALARDGVLRNSALYELLTRRALDELRRVLLDTPAARLLDPAAGAMPSNLIATVTGRLQAWSLLPDPPSGEPGFSIRKFLRDTSSGWLFLSTNERHAQVLRPLLSLWADLAATTLLSFPESERARTFCVLDEVASLQRLPALPGLLERGRKHGAAVVLGLQAMPQLRHAYGADLAASLVAQPQTWLVLRTVEPDTAKWLERALGIAEVEEIQHSYSIGSAGLRTLARNTVSMQSRISQRPAALASEIASLPDHEGFLKLPGADTVLRTRSLPRSRRPIALPFVPRSPDEPSLAPANAQAPGEPGTPFLPGPDEGVR